MYRRMILALLLLLTAGLLMGTSSVPTTGEISCNGLKLGEDYAAMEKIMGKPWYSDDRLVYGRAITYYMYKDKSMIGIANATGKIVDMIFTDDKYKLPQNIRMGATPYKMQSIYGKGEKAILDDGKVYFIYHAQNAPRQRLLMQLDSMEDFLVGIRLTTLPLDDEEADDALYNDELEDKNLYDPQIDTSAVTNDKKQQIDAKIKIKYQKSW